MSRSRSGIDERVVHAANRFVNDEVMPDWAAREREPGLASELHAKAGRLGLTLLLLPPEAGGSDVDVMTAARVAEEFGRVSLSFALPLIAHNYVAWAINDYGSVTMRESFLPRMLAGELTGIFSLTEPGAGSDAASLATRAERVEGGWKLNGEKAWVTQANHADFFIIYAQSDPGSGANGVALFLVPADTEGVEPTKPYEMLGGNGIGMGGLSLNDVFVSASNMLAPPGDGFRYALKAIDWARAFVGAIVCGMLRQSLDEAATYAAERSMFGQTTADFQAIQFVLADAATDLEASRALTDRALDALSAGDRDATVLAAHAKKFSTRAALLRIGECMQIMGANGMREDYSLARHFAGAKMSQYLDGATEVQNVVIARAMLRPRGVKVR